MTSGWQILWILRKQSELVFATQRVSEVINMRFFYSLLSRPGTGNKSGSVCNTTPLVS